MQRVLTSELRSHVGERVLLAGWLHHQRRLSRVSFALLRDRDGLAQLVLDEPLELLPETVLEVEGDVVGFTEIQTPKLVASATESGANVFTLDYFGRPAFLAQSPQFYKQAMVGVFERVYEVGPVFRAEPHETARRLAEYVSLDAELGFIDDHREVMDVVRAAVVAMIEAAGERPPAEIAV